MFYWPFVVSIYHIVAYDTILNRMTRRPRDLPWHTRRAQDRGLTPAKPGSYMNEYIMNI